MSELPDNQVQVTRGTLVPPQPAVSVVIPAWRSSTLDAAVDSVRAQTCPEPVEIIVVDDGSPEPQVPRETADLVLVRQPNGGPAAARNRGVALARAELVAFLDSDDRWRPTKLARQLDLHRRRPELVLSTTDVVFVDEAGVEFGRAATRYRQTTESLSFADLVRENRITTSAALARRAAVLTAGGFDEGRRLAEDYALWLRLGRLGPLGWVPEALVEHVDHPGSLTELAERDTSWHDHELAVYEAFLSEFPELRRTGYVADALARAWFDKGWGELRRGAARPAADCFGRSLRYRPLRARTWLNWGRARWRGREE